MFISCCVIVVIGVEGGAAGYSIVDLAGDERKEKPLVVPPAAATPDPTTLPPLLSASLFIDPTPPLLLPPPRNPKDDLLVLSSSTTGEAVDDGVARNEKPVLFAIVVEVGNAAIDNDSMGASDDAKKLNADDIIPSLTDCSCCFDALPLVVSPVAVLSLFVILGA
jgi:hypothetical protein